MEEKIAVNYICAACGKPGVAYFDPACPGWRIEKWTKALRHDCCAEFSRTRLMLRREIAGLVQIVRDLDKIILRRGRGERGEKRDAAFLTLKDRIKILTLHLANFYGVLPAWDPKLAQKMIDEPARVAWYLDTLESNTKANPKLGSLANTWPTNQPPPKP